ncbi:nuclear transport factor 2 family protein [Nocardia asiatica]|uniref:nuclear transport factor 2 family protein n=1 Tax=Nocardia asiatica TaxID=209252 RepID=UPI0024556B96|nr:nuclear transport factor 2 family protein [Nocardia asiatica]
MSSVEQITAVVREYVSRLTTGASTEIAALYAEDATVEDPVGGEVRRGRDAITAFYGPLDAVDNSAELLVIRVSGASAAFHMRVTTTTHDQVIIVEPIDVMTFDADGHITSMRAFYNPADIVSTAR